MTRPSPLLFRSCAGLESEPLARRRRSPRSLDRQRERQASTVVTLVCQPARRLLDDIPLRLRAAVARPVPRAADRPPVASGLATGVSRADPAPAAASTTATTATTTTTTAAATPLQLEPFKPVSQQRKRKQPLLRPQFAPRSRRQPPHQRDTGAARGAQDQSGRLPEDRRASKPTAAAGSRRELRRRGKQQSTSGDARSDPEPPSSAVG
jgi:hypothetical protein